MDLTHHGSTDRWWLLLWLTLMFVDSCLQSRDGLFGTTWRMWLLSTCPKPQSFFLRIVRYNNTFSITSKLWKTGPAAKSPHAAVTFCEDVLLKLTNLEKITLLLDVNFLLASRLLKSGCWLAPWATCFSLTNRRCSKSFTGRSQGTSITH